MLNFIDFKRFTMATNFPAFEFRLECSIKLVLRPFGFVGFVFFELDDSKLAYGSFDGKGFLL